MVGIDSMCLHDRDLPVSMCTHTADIVLLVKDCCYVNSLVDSHSHWPVTLLLWALKKLISHSRSWGGGGGGGINIALLGVRY